MKNGRATGKSGKAFLRVKTLFEIDANENLD